MTARFGLHAENMPVPRGAPSLQARRVSLLCRPYCDLVLSGRSEAAQPRPLDAPAPESGRRRGSPAGRNYVRNRTRFDRLLGAAVLSVLAALRSEIIRLSEALLG